MMILSQYHIFELDTINIYSVIANIAHQKMCCQVCTLIKNKIKLSSYIRKFRGTNGLPIYGEIFAQFLICVLGSPSLSTTLQPLPSDFPYILGQFCFLFYQCNSKHCSLENVLIGLYNVYFTLYYSVFLFSRK